MKNSQLFDYAYLAMASYSDFSNIDLDAKGKVKEKSIYNALRDQDRLGGFASLVSGNYDVLAHWKDGNPGWGLTPLLKSIFLNEGSGFSATLFKSNVTNSKYVLSIRGTDGWKDAGGEDVNIVRMGLAYKQIIDLYNFWTQMHTPLGQVYEAARLVDLDYLKEKRADLIYILRNLSNKEYNSLELQWQKQEELENIEKEIKRVEALPRFGQSENNLNYAIDFIPSNRLYKSDSDYAYGNGVLVDYKDKIDIVGHSLGGHLVRALISIAPDSFEQAWGFNGAGYGRVSSPLSPNAINNINKIFKILNLKTGQSSAHVKFINLIAQKGPDVVTNDWFFGLKQLENYHIFTENWNFKEVFGHGIRPIVRSLGVMSLFASLDTELDNMKIKDFLKIMNPLFEIASQDDNFSTEAILNKLFLQLTGNKLDLPKDNDFGIYHSIKVLQDIILGSESREGLSGKLKIFVNLPQNNSELVSKASTKEGIAARYALKYLNPFTLEGDILYKEKPDNSVLYTKNGMLKQDLIKLQLFDPNDKNTFAGMTAEYIAQRADMLKLTLESNWDKLSKTHNNTLYIDIDANIAATHTVIPDKNIYDTRGCLQFV